MLSHYTWWDFTKFLLVAGLPYYAYVIWTYYREDIREWISNRGQQPAPAVSLVSAAEEEEPAFSRYAVNDYSDKAVIDQPRSEARSERLVPVSFQQPANVDQPPVIVGEDDDEVELQGPRVDEQHGEGFGLPVTIEVENPAELSVDEVFSAANRLQADEKGVLSPVDADDKPAAKIAAVINNQQGHSVFADFAFPR